MQEQSITNFLNQFLPSYRKIHSLVNLSDGTVFIEILSSVPQLKIDRSETKQTPQNWQERLSNLKYLNNKINKHSSPQLFELDSDSIDLLDIAKNQNQYQIINFFEKVLSVMLNAVNKNYFIEKIMNLTQEQQELFKDKIVRSMKDQLQLSPISNSKNDYYVNQNASDKTNNHSLLSKLNELQDDLKLSREQTQIYKNLNKELQSQLQNYKEQTEKLKQNMYTLQKELLNFKIYEEKSDLESEKNSKILIQQLQNKLIEENQQNEKKYIKLQEELMIYKNNQYKNQKNENLVYEAQIKIKDLSEKVLNLKEQNDFLTNKTISLETSMKILEEKIDVQNKYIAKVEFQKISLKADNAKVNARSSQLQKMLSMSFEHRKPTQKSQIQTLQKLEDPFQTKYDQVRQELNISSRRIKELERELARSNLKLQKLQKISQDKNKLQDVLVDFTNSKNQQIKLLTYALYELRLMYGEGLKKQAIEDSTINSIQVE